MSKNFMVKACQIYSHLNVCCQSTIQTNSLGTSALCCSVNFGQETFAVLINLKS